MLVIGGCSPCPLSGYKGSARFVLCLNNNLFVEGPSHPKNGQHAAVTGTKSTLTEDWMRVYSTHQLK